MAEVNFKYREVHKSTNFRFLKPFKSLGPTKEIVIHPKLLNIDGVMWCMNKKCFPKDLRPIQGNYQIFRLGQCPCTKHTRITFFTLLDSTKKREMGWVSWFTNYRFCVLCKWWNIFLYYNYLCLQFRIIIPVY